MDDLNWKLFRTRVRFPPSPSFKKMKKWYKITLKKPNLPPSFWLGAKDRGSLDTLLEKKGYTEIESIREDPTFPECLNTRIKDMRSGKA